MIGENTMTQEKISLKRIRASLGLTQRQLAKRAHISEQALVDIEGNKVVPRLLTAYALVAALNEELVQRGREKITIDTLDWTVRE